MTDNKNEHKYTGIAVSGGVTIGYLHVIAADDSFDRSSGTPEQEMVEFLTTVKNVTSQLQEFVKTQDQLAADIIEFQISLLEDEDIIDPIKSDIDKGIPAHNAWQNKMDKEILEYMASGEEYLIARCDDLRDLSSRVLRSLSGIENNDLEVPNGTIILAKDLTPSAFLSIDWEKVNGVVIVEGSPTSHVSILAKARGLNLIVGVNLPFENLKNGLPAILDATSGNLTINPSYITFKDSCQKIEALKTEIGEIEKISKKPASTSDGQQIKVYVNIDDPEILNEFDCQICDGIGLTRTEFLFSHGHIPDEEEQFLFYNKLISWAQGKPVTIRTLDAGGDKPIKDITFDNETNPFLGVRGLRLSFARSDIFRTQLRALARAAALGPLKVMFPMVTEPYELVDAKKIMMEEIAALSSNGIEHSCPALGMMVEVPSAAITADTFDADFYSIGSNDLVQYTTATARDNASVSKLANPKNPAVLQLIKNTVNAANARNVEVSLCGDMASSEDMIAVLLSTGLRTLSCAPAQVGFVKKSIRECSINMV